MCEEKLLNTTERNKLSSFSRLMWV